MSSTVTDLYIQEGLKPLTGGSYKVVNLRENLNDDEHIKAAEFARSTLPLGIGWVDDNEGPQGLGCSMGIANIKPVGKKYVAVTGYISMHCAGGTFGEPNIPDEQVLTTTMSINGVEVIGLISRPNYLGDDTTGMETEFSGIQFIAPVEILGSDESTRAKAAKYILAPNPEQLAEISKKELLLSGFPAIYQNKCTGFKCNSNRITIKVKVKEIANVKSFETGFTNNIFTMEPIPKISFNKMEGLSAGIVGYVDEEGDNVIVATFFGYNTAKPSDEIYAATIPNGGPWVAYFENLMDKNHTSGLVTSGSWNTGIFDDVESLASAKSTGEIQRYLLEHDLMNFYQVLEFGKAAKAIDREGDIVKTEYRGGTLFIQVKSKNDGSYKNYIWNNSSINSGILIAWNAPFSPKLRAKFRILCRCKFVII